MISSKYRFSLDIHLIQSQVSIPASLGDTARILCISLTDTGKPFAIADGCMAKLSIKRPTGTYLEEFCIIKNNSIIKYDFSQNKNTAAVEGLHNCEVTLYSPNGKILTSPKFSMVVSKRAVSSDDIDLTDDNLKIIDNLVVAEAARVAAENDRVEAEAARVEAEKAREGVAEEVEEIANRAAEVLSNALKETGLHNGSGDASVEQGDSARAISDYSAAFGDGTLAGSKGFRIIASSGTNGGTGTYTLDGYTDGYSVGDKYSLRFESNYDRHGTIAAVNGNVITVDNFVSDALVVADTKYRVRGTWKFNQKLSRSAGDYTIRFVSDGVEYSGTRVYNDYADFNPTHVWRYVKADGSYVTAYSYDGISGFDKWPNDARRTVDFGDWQIVDHGFYSFLLSNATPIGGESESVAELGDKNTFRVSEKPTVGLVDIGSCAASFGSYTIAAGAISHAEGYDTLAHGKYAHTEGNSTSAAYASHAEGWFSHARGRATHAEGYSCEAIGDRSHAEGNGTKAYGNMSHAEGNNTTTNGAESHAEGYGTVADATYTHAEGHKAKAIGVASHAEGNGTQSAGQFSHAEGSQSKANGYVSHAEGQETIASGDYSHAEGLKTNASGSYSHAEGDETVASGRESHAEGMKTTAAGEQSHAEGYMSVASGNYSHAEGHKTTASGVVSHAEGNGTVAKAHYSHAEGEGTIAAQKNQHVQGIWNVEDTNNDYAFIIGNGTSDTARSNAFAVKWDGGIECDFSKSESLGRHFEQIGLLKSIRGSVKGNGSNKPTVQLGVKPKILLVSVSGYWYSSGKPIQKHTNSSLWCGAELAFTKSGNAYTQITDVTDGGTFTCSTTVTGETYKSPTDATYSGQYDTYLTYEYIAIY